MDLKGCDIVSLLRKGCPIADLNHFSEIKKAVNEKLKSSNIERKQPRRIFRDVFVLYTAWALLFGAYLYFGSVSTLAAMVLALLWTFPMLAIQMIIMHEGSHGAATDSRTMNNLLTGSISFLGGSSLLWIKQHCQAHHSFTNVHGKDHDINTNGVLRLHGSQPRLSLHRYQHYYAWFLYPLFVLDWIWWADIRDIIHNTYSMTKSELRLASLEIVFIKIWHIAVFLVLPAVVFNSIVLAIGTYLVSFMFIGFVFVVVFQLAHITNVQSLPDHESELGSDWAVRQLMTTANFATHNKFLTWFIGGLNYQVEHHIFPTMSHKNYPEISQVIQEYCEKKGLPYFSYPTVSAALSAHQKHLKKFGMQPS